MWLCYYATLLRSSVSGIRARLGTRFRMVGFPSVTALSASKVRDSLAPVSATWQGLQKKSSSSDYFFVISTHLIWNHLRHFEHPTQKRLPVCLQHLWAEQNLLIPLRDIFQSHRVLASHTSHESYYNAHFQRGDQTTNNEDRDNQGRNVLGVSKAMENL